MFKIFALKIDDDNTDILLDKMSFLSLPEISVLDKKRKRNDRALSLAAKLMLKRYVNEYENERYDMLNRIDISDLNLKEMSEIELIYSDNGKGYIKSIDGNDNENIFFNISHSGEYSVLVIGDEEVGIDVQMIRNVNEKIAEKFFHPADREIIQKSKMDKNTELTLIWCAKESYVKLIARGIGGGMDYFYEDFDKMKIIDAAGKNILGKITKVDLDDDYWCFVCTY